MATLTVPVPDLSWPPPAAGPEIETPLDVGTGPITFPDGSAVAADDALAIGAFVYRIAGAGEEIWNERDQEWQPAPVDLAALGALSPVPLTFQAAAPLPWQGVLVAAGQKDKLGANRYAAAQAGSPRYHLRAFARAQRGGTIHSGLSGVSPDFTFASATQEQRFSVAFDTPTSRGCGWARLRLEDAAHALVAFIELRATTGRELEIATCDGAGSVKARIFLTDAGDIRLEPAPGRRIVLGAELEADLIQYRPLGSPNKVYL